MRWAGPGHLCAEEVWQAADETLAALEDLHLPVQTEKLGFVASGAHAEDAIRSAVLRRAIRQHRW
eukprot:4546279-Pyramimonas_sp.AAC.1